MESNPHYKMSMPQDRQVELSHPKETLAKIQKHLRAKNDPDHPHESNAELTRLAEDRMQHFAMR